LINVSIFLTKIADPRSYSSRRTDRGAGGERRGCDGRKDVEVSFEIAIIFHERKEVYIYPFVGFRVLVHPLGESDLGEWREGKEGRKRGPSARAQLPFLPGLVPPRRPNEGEDTNDLLIREVREV